MFYKILGFRLSSSQVHPIYDGFGDPEVLARVYSERFPKSIDLGIFSLGLDGHFGSIFPLSRNGVLDTDESYVVVDNCPSFPHKRITISYNGLKRIKNVVVLVCGREKGKAFLRLFDDAVDVSQCPAKKLIGSTFFVDEEAQSVIKNKFDYNLKGARLIYGN